MNDYQLSQMETEGGELFRAKRESFLSVFPGNNSEDQISLLTSMCAELDELEEVIASLTATD